MSALPIVERLRRTAREIGPFSVVNCHFREAAELIEELYEALTNARELLCKTLPATEKTARAVIPTIDAASAALAKARGDQ